MLRNFALIDGNLEDTQVGTLSYDSETTQLSMTIFKDINPEKLPLSIEGFAKRGKYELFHEDVLRWTKGRICPPGRHNIREILRDNGLSEYDEFALLMVTMGKCDLDELYLVELD
ncbi:MAG: hypothetical protein FWG88_07325 [Oscillospiraceae bacterium]|nr:hypothetical protein [Oscillospiraceae bacterium]